MSVMQDCYAYLEDLSAPETQAFTETAHAETLGELSGSADYHRLKDDICKLLQDERQIPFCQEHRARMYHFHQSEAFPKGVYRVCSAASYRAGMPDWQILFSVADFDEILGDDVYLDGVSHYVERPSQVLLTLSVAGGDAAYTLEFDLESGCIVEGGFHFPAGKNHIAWRDADSVWVCPAWDERQLTKSGYPCEVWLIERGQSFAEGTPVYRMDADGVMVHAWRYLDPQGAPIDLIEAVDGFFSKTYLFVQGAEAVPLNLPRDCEVSGYLAGQLLLHLRSDWQRANQSYPEGSLVAVKLNKGILGEAHLLFAPNEHQALESVETTKRFIVANLLDNVSGRLKAWRFHNGSWCEEAVPDLPGGALELTDQPWGGDVVYITTSNFVTPLTLFALDLNVMELTVLRRQPKQFDAAGVEVNQYYAESSDGIRIPYYYVGRQANPETPVIVYAYGGFGVPELPHYLGSMGRHWLAEGGAFVLANIRGGGEFGPSWHKAAQGTDKYKSVDDLLAVVGDIHRRGISSPKHTALQGGSNGGLVTASAFVRKPEAVGALVCEVPLIDMLRYPYLSAGASWIEEYGDPEDEKFQTALAALSPYHHIEAGKNYPPALITTNLSDDRVHPAHALKFYAKLKEYSPHCRLYAPSSGGHTGNGTQEQTAAELAAVLVFLKKSIA
ncbi:prolyl oligopeptidase family serine peptidase [Neisseria weaveri]|uniref:prolyl oligopeptidase family serine peptidase n=1 Tax=Neisseria weaveri TaxID=28091 RepID=UPI0039896551